MSKIIYRIVQHDGGWAYRVDETFSETFASHDLAREAAERAATELDVEGFAQIGDGRFVPPTLRWARFLPHAEFRRQLGWAEVVVCHGGMGVLGEAMRANRPIVAVARRGATSAANQARAAIPILPPTKWQQLLAEEERKISEQVAEEEKLKSGQFREIRTKEN